MSLMMLKRCCFCVPLRLGLLVWAYAKMALSSLVILSLIMLSIQMANTMSESYDSAVLFLQSVTTAVPEALDLAFTVVLIISAHKRNLKMLQVYYYYSITMLAIYTLIILLSACNSRRFQMLHDMIFHYSLTLEVDYYMMLVIGFVNILVQAYLMLLVRAEVHKLFKTECLKEKLQRQKSNASFKVIGSLPPAKPATKVVNIATDI